MSAANLKLVESFCLGLAQRNMEALMGYLSDDIYYQNMPLQPITGARAVRDFMQPFLDGTHCHLLRMDIVHQATTGDVVLNARRGVWQRGELEVILPVAGVFTIAGSVIVRWEDYWYGATMAPTLGL